MISFSNLNNLLKNFLNVKKILFIVFVPLFLFMVLYSFVPLPMLTFGVMNFTTIFLVVFLLINSKEEIYWIKKNQFTGKNVFFLYSLLVFILIFFIEVLLIFFAIIVKKVFPNPLIPQLFQGIGNNVAWKEVNWFYVFFVFAFNATVAIAFGWFFTSLKLSKFNLLLIFVFIMIIDLFCGGYFINFYLNHQELNEYNLKMLNFTHNEIIQGIDFINPFFWINILSSTVFYTEGIFADYSIFSVNKNDWISYTQFVIPIFYFFVFTFGRIFFGWLNLPKYKK